MEKYVDYDYDDILKYNIKKYLNELFSINNKEILDLSNLMNYDISSRFYDAITTNNSERKDNLVNNIKNQLVGILGNFYASKYFSLQKKYSKVCLESTYYGNNIPCDLSFYDENNNLCLVEVKATEQIIGEENNYLVFDYEKSKKEIINDKKKYKQIGNKLLKQVGRLKKYSNNVKAFIFGDCYIDENIKEELNKMGVDLEILDYFSIFDIKRLAENIVSETMKKFDLTKNQTLKKVRA